MPPPAPKKSPKKKANNNLLYALIVGSFAIIVLVLTAPSSSSAAVDSQQVRDTLKKARSLFEAGNLQASVDSYREVIKAKPKSGAANLGLGISLEGVARGMQGKELDEAMAEAVKSYQTAISHGSQTEIPIAHNNLGNILRERYGNFTGALYHLKAAIETSAGVRMPVPFFYPYKNLGTLMEKNGYMEEAIANFEKAVEIERNDALKVYAKLLLPYVYKSEEDMKAWRKKYEKNLDALLKDDIKIDNPANMEGVPNYYLSYHGESDVELAKKYAALIKKATPSVDFTSPHVRTYKKPGKQIKIGFVSYYFREHSVAKMIAGLFKKLKENPRFQTVLFNISPKEDETTKFLSMMCNKYVHLPVGDFGTMRNMISMEQLDIIVYAEIGMDPNSYSLAHSRLAPVQLAMHGHADTTGVPSIDYYVTYAGFDERSFSHYSERVLRVEGHTMLPLWYDMRPFRYDQALNDESNRAALRKRYNIPADAFVFACLQTLFKLTPNMDPVMKELLEKNPDAVIIVKELPMTDKVGQFLKARLDRTLGSELSKRVIFLPPLNDADYKNVFGVVDAVIDSFPFGGHTSSMDAFSNNLPVVTLPTDLLSGRCTLGFLRMLHADELIAHNEKEFVEIASRLAQDPAFLADVKRRIKQNFPALVKDQTSVKSWEKMLVAVATGTNMHNFLV